MYIYLENTLIYENNPKLYDILKNDNKNEFENKNRLMSYWFGIIENHLLYYLYESGIKYGIIKENDCMLEYDGLIIPPFDEDKFDLTG